MRKLGLRLRCQPWKTQNQFNQPLLQKQDRGPIAIAILTLALVQSLSLGSPKATPNRAVAQVSPVPQATVTARSEARAKQERQVRPENYNLQAYPVSDKHERHWKNILWTTAIVQPQEAFVGEAVAQILSLTSRPGLSPAQKRTVGMALQVGTQLYLSNPIFYSGIGEQFLQTLDRSPNPEWTAMALSALAHATTLNKNGALGFSQIQQLSSRVQDRFPRWSDQVALSTTLKDIAEFSNPAPVPPLKDLLNWTIAPRQIQLYVICTPNRQALCQAVVKGKDGQFVRQNGQLWSVPLLLRSIHNLSWNFERGETPQGIYRMEGREPQPDLKFFKAFGQFALVNLFIPFEPGVKSFLPDKQGMFKGSISEYQSLLPPSWRGYRGIEQSYWAGRNGRSLFRIHGSGEGLEFFPGKENPDSYEWNPTIGCLSAAEIYDESGRLVRADMPKILNVLTQLGGKQFTGYVVVVEVPAQTIELSAIEALVEP